MDHQTFPTTPIGTAPGGGNTIFRGGAPPKWGQRVGTVTKRDENDASPKTLMPERFQEPSNPPPEIRSHGYGATWQP
jgi:hypothetical protein